jgi:hypothetical protein
MKGRTEGGGVRRRRILQGAAIVAASSWIGSAARAQGTRHSAVIFLSRSGNTRMLAGHLSLSLTDVTPISPWPSGNGRS